MICHSLPPCARPGCGAPACDHAAPEPHVLHARDIWCDGYELPEGMSLGEFEGGGGSGGGGGATGSW